MAKKNTHETALRRCAARLAAVQALYQIDMSQGRLEDVIRDFLSGAIGGEVIEEDLDLETEKVVPLIELNAELFSVLVRGVAGMRERLDEVIDASLAQGWDAERLQPVLRSVLRCGLYELMEREDVPPRAAVAEYVDIARSFYDGPEAGLVNAVLDRLARQLRSDEMGAPRRPRQGSDDAAQ
ncbi:transcription antitermination factor NusB [Insolitispirillum peregrinum]|uniref:Transcription antitermination protein NusB n=1 Tax=Insolitispirillum peregrinum TaxID=80876 RepID=A0A1N7INN3_9PROT|nr:transcription antitermination factor NusB [Insolitispirillum peregrinum]SIS38662.1 NusB antitermination factor [Insolitispirillum peregrinum]